MSEKLVNKIKDLKTLLKSYREDLEKAKYLSGTPELSAQELARPARPPAVAAATPEALESEYQTRASAPEFRSDQASRVKQDIKGKAATKREAKQAKADREYKAQTEAWHHRTKTLPWVVLNGIRLDFSGKRQGAATDDRGYNAIKERPMGLGSKAQAGSAPGVESMSEPLRVSMSDDKGSMFRVRQGKTHLLKLHRQGDDPHNSISIHVSPEEYDSAIKTGIHPISYDHLVQAIKDTSKEY